MISRQSPAENVIIYAIDSIAVYADEGRAENRFGRMLRQFSPVQKYLLDKRLLYSALPNGTKK